MNIITTHDLNKRAIDNLSNLGNIILLKTKNIVYKAISNHPDIFCCPIDDELIVAPNAPQEFIKQLTDLNYSFGMKMVGKKYPDTAIYNLVISENFLVGNLKIADEIVLEKAGNRKQIHVNQAYTRCNLLPLPGDRFICSDKGIEKELRKYNIECLYVNPENIILNGHKHGFFGGCCGVNDNKVFINGSLNFLPEAGEIREFLSGFEIIELYKGRPEDIGSLFFV